MSVITLDNGTVTVYTDQENNTYRVYPCQDGKFYAEVDGPSACFDREFFNQAELDAYVAEQCLTLLGYE